MTYYVYMLVSDSGVLYVGVTNDLRRRVEEHRSGLIPGFTARYNIHKLLWFERFADVRDALVAEKRLKGWNRSRKIALIEQHNPRWLNLAEHLDLK